MKWKKNEGSHHFRMKLWIELFNCTPLKLYTCFAENQNTYCRSERVSVKIKWMNNCLGYSRTLDILSTKSIFRFTTWYKNNHVVYVVRTLYALYVRLRIIVWTANSRAAHALMQQTCFDGELSNKQEVIQIPKTCNYFNSFLFF